LVVGVVPLVKLLLLLLQLVCHTCYSGACSCCCWDDQLPLLLLRPHQLLLMQPALLRLLQRLRWQARLLLLLVGCRCSF
jgi:hypothetical protein